MSLSEELLAVASQLRNGIVQFAQGVRQEPELAALAHTLSESILPMLLQQSSAQRLDE
jgi:hypothetical protein